VLLEAGVAVTLGSDDPGMFDTTLVDEYVVAAEVLGVSRDGLADIARTGVRRSYAPDGLKRQLLEEIDGYTR
jgi:aminodeoxyfutalosine deaminase